jgi:hypothetical protein
VPSLVNVTLGVPVVVNGVIVSIPILNGGAGQATTPTITITDPTTGLPNGAKGAQVTLVMTNGVVTGVNVVSGGTGYTKPTVTVSNGGSVVSTSGGTTGPTTSTGTGTGTKPSTSPTGKPTGGGPKSPPGTANPNSSGQCPAGYGSFPVYGRHEITGYGTYKNAIIGYTCAKGTEVDTAYGRCKLPEFALYMINIYCSYLIYGGGGQQPTSGANGRNNANNLGRLLGGIRNGGGGGLNPGNGGNQERPQRNPADNGFIMPKVVKDPPPQPPKPELCSVSDYELTVSKRLTNPAKNSFILDRSNNFACKNEETNTAGIKKSITINFATYIDEACTNQEPFIYGELTPGDIYPYFRGFINSNGLIVRLISQKQIDYYAGLEKPIITYAPLITGFIQKNFTYCFVDEAAFNSFERTVNSQSLIAREELQSHGVPNEFKTGFRPNIKNMTDKDGKDISRYYDRLKNTTLIPHNNKKYIIGE